MSGHRKWEDVRRTKPYRRYPPNTPRLRWWGYVTVFLTAILISHWFFGLVGLR